MEDRQNKNDDVSYLELVQEIVGSIKYGTVSIVIQDGKVVQIDKNEKYRIKN